MFVVFHYCLTLSLSLCLPVCVCLFASLSLVCVRLRACVSVCVFARVRACARAFVCACVRATVYVRVTSQFVHSLNSAYRLLALLVYCSLCWSTPHTMNQAKADPLPYFQPGTHAALQSVSERPRERVHEKAEAQSMAGPERTARGTGAQDCGRGQ